MGTTYLAIDHGDRRIGLAYGDDEIGIAFKLPAAVEPESEARIQHIGREIKQRRATALVVGYPLNMDGTEGPRTQVVDIFIARLEELFNLPVHRVDEGLSSVAADSTFSSRQRGRTARQRQQHRASGEEDSRAAAVILQDFLNSRPMPLPSFDEEEQSEYPDSDPPNRHV
ncbi:MAG: Holliday junction resolvase RuvX [Puniceicoccales bacterium]|jgi:putative Holliday junction resolvase|nr:Holliday junction resolvase RuvX [Puniceicoccales bacterium]